MTKPDQVPSLDNPTDGDTQAGCFNIGGGRRERSTTGRRPEVVKLRLTEAERGELAAHAGQRGITVQRYLLECVAAVQAGGAAETESDRREDMATLLGVRKLLANVANNVNPIARTANAGAVPTYGDATAALNCRGIYPVGESHVAVDWLSDADLIELIRAERSVDVEPSTIRSSRMRSRGPAYSRVEHQGRYRRNDVLRWLAEQRETL